MEEKLENVVSAWFLLFTDRYSNVILNSHL